MTKALWILTLIGALLGGLALIAGLMTAQSAPQEASAAAIAVALAVIPYCMARAWDGLMTAREDDRLRRCYRGWDLSTFSDADKKGGGE